MNIIQQYLKDQERPASWLARKAGLAPSTVIAHAEGKQKPGLDALQAYHRATGLPETELFRWDLPEPTEPGGGEAA